MKINHNPEDGSMYFTIGNVTLDPIYGSQNKYIIQVDNHRLQKTEILNGYIKLDINARGA